MPSETEKTVAFIYGSDREPGWHTRRCFWCGDVHRRVHEDEPDENADCDGVDVPGRWGPTGTEPDGMGFGQDF